MAPARTQHRRRAVRVTRPRYPSDERPRERRRASGTVPLSLTVRAETATLLASLAAEAGQTKAAVVELGIQLVAWKRRKRA